MRKLGAATLALAVAGGVYMTAVPAEASNMGFKLERSFSVVRRTPNVPTSSFKDFYFLSFPLFNGLGDVGNTSVPSPGNKCVGDAGSTAVPDGIIDTTDALCDLWTDRTGSMSISRFDRDTCQYAPAGVTKGIITSWSGVPFVLERDAGFQITVNSTLPNVIPVNRAVIVGSHDPSYTGRTIRYPASGCTPSNDIINLPYHTMYQKASEVLCGLEGVDWVDVAAPLGSPDTCFFTDPVVPANSHATGIFDNVHAITVLTFDNIPDANGTDDSFIPRKVTRDFRGNLQFVGPDFALTPGDAYIVSISPGHVPTTFLSPHF